MQSEEFALPKLVDQTFVQETSLYSNFLGVNNSDPVESEKHIPSSGLEIPSNVDERILPPPNNVRNGTSTKAKNSVAKGRKSLAANKKHLGKGYHWPKENILKLIKVWDMKIIDLFTRKRQAVYKEIREILAGMGMEATSYIIRLKLNYLTSTYKRKIRKDTSTWIYFDEIHAIFNKLRAFDPVLATNFLDKCEKLNMKDFGTLENGRTLPNSSNNFDSPEKCSNNQNSNLCENTPIKQEIKEENESSSECPVNEEQISEATEDAPEVPKSDIPSSSEDNSNVAAQNVTEENPYLSLNTINDQQTFNAKEKRRTRSKSPDTTTGRSYKQREAKRTIQDRILDEMKKANDLAEYELRESTILLNKAHHLEEKRLKLTEHFVKRSMAIQETLVTFMNYHHQGGSF